MSDPDFYLTRKDAKDMIARYELLGREVDKLYEDLVGLEHTGAPPSGSAPRGDILADARGAGAIRRLPLARHSTRPAKIPRVGALSSAEIETWMRTAVAVRFPGGADDRRRRTQGRRFDAPLLARVVGTQRRRSRNDGRPGRHAVHHPRLPPPTAIAIDLGPDDLPLYARALNLLPEPLAEPPWINLQRFLASIGAAVPALYAADISARMLLVEDVGELPLFEAALHGDGGDLYRLAADELLVFHP